MSISAKRLAPARCPSSPGATRIAIIADAYGQVSVRYPLAIRLGARGIQPPDSALDFLARAGLYLLFRVLLPRLSDPRADWTGRDSSGQPISARRIRFGWFHPRAMVCADSALA